MNRAEQKIVHEAELIVYLWLSFADKNDKLDGIAGTSPSMMGAVSDFKGDIPRGGNFKPETVAARADRQRQIPITEQEKMARDAMMSLPIRDRLIVAAWPQLKKKENDSTGQLYTMSDMIKTLRLSGVVIDGEASFLAMQLDISERLVAAARAIGMSREELVWA